MALLDSLKNVKNEDSDDDEDDDDYVPSGADESDDDIEGAESDDSISEGKKSFSDKNLKQKHVKSHRGIGSRAESKSQTDADEENLDVKEDPQEGKKKSDLLWADFLSDVAPPTKKTSTPMTSISLPSKTTHGTILPQPPMSKKVTITEVFEFAGESVVVNKEVDADSTAAKRFSAQEEKSSPSPAVSSSSKSVLCGKRPSGLGSVLGQVLGKKNKLSTLDKSKLDWKEFTKAEGMEEDLTQYKKSKNGFLDRQAFLERTDLRQFEREKELRSVTRSHRM